MKKHFIAARLCANNRGYIVLMSVIVIAAITATLMVSLTLFGIGSARAVFGLEQSKKARASADACVEDALQTIHDNEMFIGTSSLALLEGVCFATVTSQGEQNRTITSTGRVGLVVRKVKVIIDAIDPQINLISWQEVDNF